jgi:hypothetical protein
MKNLHIERTPAASGVTRRNSRSGRRCPRCLRFGRFAPSCIVCDRCADALPLVVTVAISMTFLRVGGGR